MIKAFCVFHQVMAGDIVTVNTNIMNRVKLNANFVFYAPIKSKLSNIFFNFYLNLREQINSRTDARLGKLFNVLKCQVDDTNKCTEINYQMKSQ